MTTHEPGGLTEIYRTLDPPSGPGLGRGPVRSCGDRCVGGMSPRMGRGPSGAAGLPAGLDKMEAYLLRSGLEAQGITTARVDDVSAGLIDGSALPVRLMVSAQDAERARQVVEDFVKGPAGG